MSTWPPLHFALPACRYPNAGAAEGAELCTHGCWANGIKEWHKNTSCVGKAEVIYKVTAVAMPLTLSLLFMTLKHRSGWLLSICQDLRDCDNEMKIASGPLAGQPCKNDSAMWDTYSECSHGRAWAV